ncbi:MAG: hypothetical protein R3305_03910 [Gammaproteobacteria bacterium]|nr:hypothetical protein [Gammaproteobacteria bacterium]
MAIKKIDLTMLAPTVAGLTLVSVAAAQQAGSIVPAEQTAAAVTDPNWRVGRMSWGDPDLEGTFTSRDMSGIPMSRPAQFGNRQHLTPAELEERLNAPDRLAGLAGDQEFENRLELSALDSAETGTRTFGYTSYIIYPENGQMPALTAEGQRRQQANQRSMNGPFYTTEDFSYYDRCISRGVTGSIGPSLYGDAMRIVQSPTEVAITYEMLHDTRIIPLDGRPPADDGVRQYMGSSTGYWDGDTLVIETTNFTDELAVGRMVHSEDLKLTERLTRIDPDMIDYVVTVDDPRTFEGTWTYRLTLTTQPGYEILEYSCHEGNFFVANALRAEKVYQESVLEAIANGEPIPARPQGISGRSIFAPPDPSEAVNINATN